MLFHIVKIDYKVVFKISNKVLSTFSCHVEAYSEPYQTCSKEHLAKMVAGFDKTIHKFHKKAPI